MAMSTAFNLNAHQFGKKRNIRRRHDRRNMLLERLEHRSLMVGEVEFSISDASAWEGGGNSPFIDEFAADETVMQWPSDLAFGPDGDLFVLGRESGNVVRFDGETGELEGVFVPTGSGGLLQPNFLSFGADGHLYVASFNTATNLTDQILRFDGSSGAPLPAPGKSGADFVSSGAGGLAGARSPTFGPDGNLYVSSVLTNQVLKFDGTSGDALGVFIDDHLDKPAGIQFRDGSVYVANSASKNVVRFDANTGNYLNDFVPVGSGALGKPNDMEFGRDGHLYVVDETNRAVLRFNGHDGQFIDQFAGSGAGELDGNVPFLTFGNDGLLYVANDRSNNVLRFGTQLATFEVRLDEASDVTTAVSYATSSESGTAAAGSDYTASTGILTFAPGEVSKTVVVTTLGDTLYEGNETFTVNLSNPVGGVIVDGQGVGTIIDNDPQPTKFYVVDDASANKTFEYGASGSAVENYGLNTGNAAPRGAASTVAGNKVWVVDANRKVFVYDTSGGLLGSWTAGTLANNAQPEGIATNGTDVWIVDAKSDKVFRYTGAASRLSGSQNAASSFNLASGNGAPKDIVTNGTHFWVVNDASQDKVFKYTVAGGSLGNWTLTGGGGAPTGITLDPAAPAHLWIVDSATDRVYQYDNAVGRTSGSQASSTSFALAAGNTNPQGIADPPVPTAPSEANEPAASRGTARTHADATDEALLALLGDWDLFGSGVRKKRR